MTDSSIDILSHLDSPQFTQYLNEKLKSNQSQRKNKLHQILEITLRYFLEKTDNDTAIEFIESSFTRTFDDITYNKAIGWHYVYEHNVFGIEFDVRVTTEGVVYLNKSNS